MRGAIFGEAVQRWRKAAGVRQNVLDRLVGPVGSAAQMERGSRRPPPTAMLPPIADLLGVSIEELHDVAMLDRVARGLDDEELEWIGAQDVLTLGAERDRLAQRVAMLEAQMAAARELLTVQP